MINQQMIDYKLMRNLFLTSFPTDIYFHEFPPTIYKKILINELLITK